MPHKDWRCVSVQDLREEAPDAPLATCEMCGQESIRYVHTMLHKMRQEPLDVGCVCAEKMAVGYDVKGAERRLRNRASRRKTFVESGWRAARSGTGNLWRRKNGVMILVGKGQYGFFAKVGEQFLKGKFASLHAAKVAAFNKVDDV